MALALIAAVAANSVIGNRGALPWRLPDDLARFKRLTMGHPVIMGRATYQSIGKPLAGRRNLVLTRDASAVFPGSEPVHSRQEALGRCAGQDAFVIGGASVYELFLPAADLLYLTWIDAEVPGDTFFPAVRWDQWRVVSEQAGETDARAPLPHRFVDYQRIR